MKMIVRPLTLTQANELVAQLHRHHKPVIGHRFSLGLYAGEHLCGAVIIGRPVSRELPQYEIAEVTRLVTDGTANACSKLYAAAARVCREMGFRYIQTYILQSEPGTSLLAVGWRRLHQTKGGSWNCTSRGGRRDDQPQEPKVCWRLGLTSES